MLIEMMEVYDTNVVQLVRIKQEVDRIFLWYYLAFQIKPLNSYSDGDFIEQP